MVGSLANDRHGPARDMNQLQLETGRSTVGQGPRKSSEEVSRRLVCLVGITWFYGGAQRGVT